MRLSSSLMDNMDGFGFQKAMLGIYKGAMR